MLEPPILKLIIIVIIIYFYRALGMVWIIAGHLFFYGPSAIENLHMIFTYAETWYLQPLFAVAIAVDTYFVIRCQIEEHTILIWNFR